jgi:hypothetical protein
VAFITIVGVVLTLCGLMPSLLAWFTGTSGGARFESTELASLIDTVKLQFDLRLRSFISDAPWFQPRVAINGHSHLADEVLMPPETTWSPPIRAVIVGGAGSGKTSLLRHLGRQLAARLKPHEREDDPRKVISTEDWPLLISATSFRGGDIQALISAELQRQYGARGTIARLLEKNDPVFLLIDGLDEVDELRRIDLISAVGRYGKFHKAAQIVLTTREIPASQLTALCDEWKFPVYRIEALDTARINSHVDAVLRRVPGQHPEESIRAFLRLFSDKPQLQPVLFTPFFLELALSLHLHGALAAVANSSDSPDEFRDRLVQEHLQQSIQSDRQMRRTAAWLAYQLSQRGYGATLALPQLTPLWLVSSNRVRQRRETNLAFGIMGALTAAPFAAALAIWTSIQHRGILFSSVTFVVGTLIGGIGYSFGYRLMHEETRREFPAWIRRLLPRTAPLTAQKRIWRLGPIRAGLIYETDRVLESLWRNLAIGLVGGLVLHFLAPWWPEFLRGRVLIVTTAAIVGVVTVAGGAAIGPFVGGMFAVSAWGLIDHRWWLALATGLVVGGLAWITSTLAEFGETTQVAETETVTSSRIFLVNLVYNLTFELLKWSIFGIGFGLAMNAVSGNSRWLSFGLWITIIGTAFYGLAGGLFPYMLYKLTEWRLGRTVLPGIRLEEQLKAMQTPKVALLQNVRQGGMSVRFAHPLLASALSREWHDMPSGETRNPL